MSTRSHPKRLARELRNRSFAAEYFLTLIEGEDGLNFLDALKHTIQRMGIKEFAKRAKLHPKSVSRMLASDTAPKFETLDHYLAPLGLQAKLVTEKRAA